MTAFRRLWHRHLRQPFRLNYEHHRSHGKNPKHVLLLHGIASDHTFWAPLITLLEERGCEVVAPDLLGHGSSPKPDFIQYSTEDQARAVIALLKRRRYTDLTIVGHSMGSLVATRIATLEPTRVKQLLLYEPPLFADLPEFKTHARRKKFYFDLFERIAANPSGTVTMARIVARVARNWTKYLQSEQAWLPIERSLRNAIMQPTSFEELKGITIQTDIVHGRLDVVVPKAELKLMLKDNVNITFHKTTDRHGISRASARYLAQLIAPKPQKRDNKKRTRRVHESTLEQPSYR